MIAEPIKFPGWRFGPNGEAQIFEREEDVPDGWTDNPNDFKKAENEPHTALPEEKKAQKPKPAKSKLSKVRGA